ncbi:SPASM domain-containing protein [Metallosphaera tengchongensis]|uniref:SPASM domain-containing protein n=1 Tax=Metallosphaera tengchongensis TaxID=1532350 RepID=UPI001FE6099E|nr:SPASM domain-containing protein [Metallosphaera tengchongensis]
MLKLIIRPHLDYVEEIVRKALDLGFEFVEIHQLLKVDHAYFNHELINISDEKDIDRVLRIKQRLSDIYKGEILFDFNHEIAKGLRPFPNTWGHSLIVEPNGDVFVEEEASFFLELSLGNIKKATLREIWENSDLLRKIREFKYPAKRSTCELTTLYRGGSRFITYLLTRDLFEVIPGCPRLNKVDQKR